MSENSRGVVDTVALRGFFFVTFPYEKNTRIRHKKDNDLLVAIVTTTRNVDNKRFEQWLRYHENVGFAMFYAFLDGENSMTPTTRVLCFPEEECETAQ